MNREEHLALLRDESKSVVDRIKSAIRLGEVDYWCDPNKSPPNLAREEFERLIVFIPSRILVRWEPRKSDGGPHGATGEDQIFEFEFEIPRGKYRFVYYLKGYFYDKSNLRGVCIQSFRIDRKINRGILRPVR